MPALQCDICAYEPEFWIPLFSMEQERIWSGECRKRHRVTKSQWSGKPPTYSITREWIGTVECKDFKSLVPF